MVAHLLTDVAGRKSFMVQGIGKGGRGKGGKSALFQPMFLVDIMALESSHTQIDRV